MNFDQFAASFRNPEVAAPCAEAPVEAPTGQVTIAGAVLSVSDNICCLEVNSVRYEVSARDVIEIGDLVPAPASPVSDTPAAAEKKGSEPKASSKAASPASESHAAAEKKDSELKASPRLVLITIAANANLYTRVAVPAVLVAAVGTWVTVVPQEAPPTEEQTAKAA